MLLSEYSLNHISNVSDVDFIVDTDFSRGGLSYENCKFTFTEAGSLSFNNCTLTNCTFIGIVDFLRYDERRGYLNIENSRNNSLILGGQFKQITLRNLYIQSIADSSTSQFLNYFNNEVLDFKILGSCKYLHIDKTIFSSKHNTSIWNKAIILEATCTKAIYDNVKVNPFYLATKCHNKESLDLTRATLIDEWSSLRKKYSGLGLFLVFFLTFLFFVPLFTRSFFLLTLAKIDPSYLIPKHIPLWDSIFFNGKSGLEGFIHLILTITLLIYNVARIFMTITIAQFREEEIFLKDSDFRLVSIHPEKIKLQVRVNKVLNVMLFISIGYTLFKLITALFIEVPIV